MPPRKEICDCQVMENCSREPGHPVRWDEDLHEYYIAHGTSGKTRIYYCFFCGGKAPESRRASKFHHISDAETTRIINLVRGVKTLAEVIEKFGPPDSETDFGSASTRPASGDKPPETHLYPGANYTRLSSVADIHFNIGHNGVVHAEWHAKPIRDEPIE